MKIAKLKIVKLGAGLIVLAGLIIAFFWLTRTEPQVRLAADTYIGFNEGYGSTVSETVAGAASGTITNATWKTEDLCLSGKCLFFDGSGDYVSFGDDADYDFTASANWTISLWFRHAPKTSGTDVLIAKTNASAGYKLYMESDGDITFAIDDDASWDPDASVSSTAATYDDNRWHHIAAVKTGTTSIELYIDGLRVGQNLSVSGVGDLTNSANFYVGIDGDGSSNSFTGFIDELKVYTTTAKTADQVKTDTLRTAASSGVAASFGPDQSYLSDGLVGYWKMDETATPSVDSSGNGNSGTWSGNTTNAAGKYGNSAFVDGTDDYISVGDKLDMTDNDAFTVSVWFYPTANTQTSTLINKKSDVGNPGSQGYTLTWWNNGDGDNTCLYASDGSSNGSDQYEVCTPDHSTDTLNQWYHIVAVFDNKSFEGSTIYLNGVAYNSYEACNNCGGSTPDFSQIGDMSNSQSFCIGTNSQVGGTCQTANEYTGRIDEVRVYNRVLSPTEVQNLYEWAPGPVAYYPFDEGTGTSNVYDRSGQGAIATMNGSMTQSDWVNGKFSSALDFDGSNDRINGGSASVLDNMPMISVSAWIYPRTHGELDEGLIVSKESGGDDGGWGFSLNYNGASRFFVGRDTAAIAARTLQGQIPLNQWSHLSAVWNGSSIASEIKFYLNGNALDLDTSSNGSGNRDDDSAQNLNIGNEPGTTQTFDGIIDDVRVYNYQRTQDQIIEDMNAGHPAPGSPVGSALGHWKFDEGYGDTAYDSGTGGNNGDLAGSGTTCPQSGDSACPAWSNSGKFGKALNFDVVGTTDDYVYIGNPASLNLTKNFTLSAWINPDSLINKTVISKITDAGSKQYQIWITGGEIRMEYEKSGNNYFLDTVNSGVTTGSWSHVLVTVDDSLNITTYINGVVKASGVAPAEVSTSSDPMTIGYRAGTYNDTYFDGLIDEVKIYNFALTADQVKTEYNQGKAVVFGATSTDSSGNASWSSTDSYCPPGQGTACVGPVVEFKFDENSGQSINDTTGNLTAGTLGLDTSISSNDPVWIVGKKGTALQFDGSNDYARHTDDALFTPANDMTASIWFKMDILPSIAGHTYWIFAKNNSTGPPWQSYYCVVTTSNQAVCYWASSTDPDAIQNTYTTFTLQANTWYFLTFIRESGYTKIYINGQPDLVNAVVSGTTKDSDYTFDFGGNVGANQSWFDGAIDDFKLYNYARTPAQIAWEYNQGGPVGWWKLNENQAGDGLTVYDSSGNGNNGVTEWGAGSGMDCTVNGKRNKACDFDGSDDYISVTDPGTSSILDFTTGQTITISAWINPSAIEAGGYSTILSKGQTTDTNNANYKFYLSDTGSTNNLNLGYNRSSDSAWQFARVNDVINLDEWQHVAVTYTLGTNQIIFYLNGEPLKVNYTSIGDTPSVSNDPLWIGANDYSGGTTPDEEFVGKIDDVKIWNYALIQKQIEMEYNQGAVNFAQ